MSDDDYPGRRLKDAERTPLGLGWEYARRGWSVDGCPFVAAADRASFRRGFDRYICSDSQVDEAMLTKPRRRDGNRDNLPD